MRDKALPITIESVTKTYGDIYALDNVDLSIQSGEFLTLLGPSGSGKTTLLMVLAGFIRPDHGNLWFGDSDVIRTPPHQRDVGMVFQNYALFPHMSVAANVGFPLKIRKTAKHELSDRVEQALETVQLGGYGDRSINQLSGGQRQRVALARAIVFAPRILLMDEPLSALDKNLREQMQIELRHLHEKLGMTTVYVTHDQREALTMSDRIAVINQGKLMQLDSPRQLYEKPDNKFVAEFIGESSFLPVSRANGSAYYGNTSLKVNTLPDSEENNLLMLRPESLRVVTDNTSHLPFEEMNIFEGEVRENVYQGESFLMYVTLDDGSRVTVRGVTRNNEISDLPSIGERARLGLHQNDTVLIVNQEG